MRLRIEDGILLKPYARSWHPDGWAVAPAGWTPDDTCEWVTARAYKLVRDGLEAGRVTSHQFALSQAAREHGDYLDARRLPWPGWVPVGLGPEDRKLRKAYRELFIDMNPGRPVAGPLVQRVKADYPPDGFYEFKGGKMVREEDG